MRGREMPVAILDQVQMLDEEIAPALALTEHRADLLDGLGLVLAAFGVSLGCSPRLSAPTFAVVPTDAVSSGWRRSLNVMASRLLTRELNPSKGVNNPVPAMDR